MGYILHHAIVVTTWDEESAEQALVEANRLGLDCSGLVASHMNGYRSLLIAPDGSKEGWDYSDAGDDRRDEFKAWMKTLRSLSWVEVAYGNDDAAARVVDHKWRNT